MQEMNPLANMQKGTTFDVMQNSSLVIQLNNLEGQDENRIPFFLASPHNCYISTLPQS